MNNATVKYEQRQILGCSGGLNRNPKDNLHENPLLPHNLYRIPMLNYPKTSSNMRRSPRSIGQLRREPSSFPTYEVIQEEAEQIIELRKFRPGGISFSPIRAPRMGSTSQPTARFTQESYSTNLTRNKFIPQPNDSENRAPDVPLQKNLPLTNFFKEKGLKTRLAVDEMTKKDDPRLHDYHSSRFANEAPRRLIKKPSVYTQRRNFQGIAF